MLTPGKHLFQENALKISIIVIVLILLKLRKYLLKVFFLKISISVFAVCHHDHILFLVDGCRSKPVYHLMKMSKGKMVTQDCLVRVLVD